MNNDIQNNNINKYKKYYEKYDIINILDDYKIYIYSFFRNFIS